MNKKNKNKIRSKPTEPAPESQKSDTAQSIDEAIKKVMEEKLGSIAKEINSAVEGTNEIKELVQESDVILNDTPKKPKRNKGKKKKQEEIGFDENMSVSIQDSRSVLPAISASEMKVKDENLAESLESTVSTLKEGNIKENVPANVSKKKNKKKRHEHTQKVDELSQEFDFQEKMPEDLRKEDSVTTVTKLDVSTHETIESETKQTKKKNKKKKYRSDSEKSDKADETVICTAAFQKLISSPDNESDINSGVKIEDGGKGDKITSGEEEILKDLVQSVLLPEESKQLKDEALTHNQINESKGKKKNKKDKKHLQPKPDTEKSNLTQERLESSSINTDIVQEILSIDQVEYAIKDTIPKAKAKIAKPVEKKRRGKTETSEGDENKELEDIILHDVDLKEPVLEIEKIPEHICGTGVNIQYTDETVKAEQKIESETTVMCTEKCPETLIPTDIISLSTGTTGTPIDERNSNLAHANFDMKSSEAITKSLVIASNPVLLCAEKNTNESLFSLEEPEDNTAIISEPYKTVDKKKKKHPKKIDICAEKKSEKEVLLTPESKSTNETILQQNEDSGLSTLSPSIDNSIEISSLKTDELDGSSDVTPDFIHYPLATSQQLIDNNNNMTIREISTTEEKLSFYLQIPTEPIIQNSGETPELVEEKTSNVTPSLNVIKERSVPNEPEKTDLKSKMMEVSQDMEELRLSIERSLAELTSMEKSEEDVVKHIETPQIVTTTELKSSYAKDDISEKSRLITENILGEIISSETIESKPKEQEIISNLEDIEESKLEMPLLMNNDDHRNVALKETPPQVPVRKDNKGKGKRKCKPDIQFQQPTTVPETTTDTSSENTTNDIKEEEKVQPEQKSQSSESNENKGKQQQQVMQLDNCKGSEQVHLDLTSNIAESSFKPIESFEDALTSSADDVNKTFEMIANEVNNTPDLTVENPQINITSPTEDTETAEPKRNPVSPPKNLLGHPDIPVPSNRTDYKKEKNKDPNMRQAKVKIKDAVDIEKMEKTKQAKESQTENKRKVVINKNVLESFSYVTNENAEYVYKYSFRKVFLQSLCHVCRKELRKRVSCQFCSLVFYCSQRHKDEDWPQHQSLCFAISTIAHLKDHKHIYAESKNITGQSYRLLRMQMIISCEKMLKRKLVPWEQEALLYPRICADITCREWKQSKLADCEGCGQISYCSENPTHLPASHKRWCKSYGLYQKLVHHQQTRGRLEPKLPAGIVVEGFRIPDKINEVLAAMYNDKIDMTDMEYAALTQLATAPLTAAYCHDLATTNHSNGISKNTSFVVHIVGAELQFEADVLFKWELFFLHLKPHLKELKVVLVSPDLNPSNLPLNLLEKVNLCEGCRAQKRRVLFSFQDKKTYHEYWASDEFSSPDIVCAFNSSIQRSSMYNGKDTWPTAVSCILKLKAPFVITSYSIDEMNRDLSRIKECSDMSGISFKTISGTKCNPFASVRPDRNFITDDEIPLLFKNHCFVVLCGI